MEISSVNIKSPNNNNHKREIKAQVAGLAGGYATAGLSGTLISSVNTPIIYKIVKNARSLNDDANSKIFEAFDTMLKKTGLKNKYITVEIFNRSDLDIPKFREKLQKAIALDKSLNIKPGILKDIIVSDACKNTPEYAYIVGVNAGYNFTNNRIAFADNFVAPIPHEAGHAVMNNGKHFDKIISKIPYLIRRFNILPATLMLGLLTRKHENKGNKELSSIQKAENFIHNNLGLITGAITVPTLVMEGRASWIGEKHVKPLLPKNIFKNVKINNRLGLMSYAANTCSAIIGAHLAVKAKDKIYNKILASKNKTTTATA